VADLMAFGIALIASLGLTVPIRRLALRIGMVDQPNPRKVHRTPMPLLGGLAIYAGFVLAILFSTSSQVRSQIVGILAGATLLAAIGFLDDRGWLHPQIKLFVGMPFAAVLLLASGIRAGVVSYWLPSTTGHLLDAALTIFWVVGITAAFSILDHMDGLCAGIAAIAAAFFALLAIQSGQFLVSTLAAAVLGAALGFLRWNFRPAKIFMGDGGALFLGFLMAALGLKLRLTTPTPLASWLAPVLILGVPIFDTTLISISRARRGLLPFASPGKDHAAHRLANLGLGHRGAVLTLYSAGLAFGLSAWLIIRLPERAVLSLAVAVVLVMLVALAALERAPYERQLKPSRSAQAP
jgi:UDP-GlcNAc:undecaprenyl-phosphate GlcNAc-1-phosphate transferase